MHTTWLPWRNGISFVDTGNPDQGTARFREIYLESGPEYRRRFRLSWPTWVISQLWYRAPELGQGEGRE